MKLKRSKKWYASHIPAEEGEIGAGSLCVKSKLTWADKVKSAIASNSELKDRIRVFNFWRKMVEAQPEKYRIIHFCREFRFEEAIVREHEYDNFTVEWREIAHTRIMKNSISEYINNLVP